MNDRQKTKHLMDAPVDYSKIPLPQDPEMQKVHRQPCEWADITLPESYRREPQTTAEELALIGYLGSILGCPCWAAFWKELWEQRGW